MDKFINFNGKKFELKTDVQTDKAELVYWVDGDEICNTRYQSWIPKSILSNPANWSDGLLIIPEWFLQKMKITRVNSRDMTK